MARKARELSQINSYTIILRCDDEKQFNAHDKQLLLETIKKYSSVLCYKLLAYNFNDTMFTFVLYDCDTAIDTTMKKIVVSFVSKYNLYHKHTGKVFKGRFVSFPANTIKSVWNMVYDVHNLGDSEFNSKNNYYEDPYINLECVKQFYGSKENFDIAVLNRQNDSVLKSSIKKSKINDAELINYITKEVMPVEDLSNLPKSTLSKVISAIIKATSASARQLARITSLPLRWLWNLSKNKSSSEGENEQK